MHTPLLVYGAYGYTGRLIVQEALARGLRPVLAGRDSRKLATLAGETGLESREFPLDIPVRVEAGLEGMRCVLHCAGPFAHTAVPMAEACLRKGVHYTDITGEISVFEAMAGRTARAREAGVMLMPGVGFDVVPSDCLAVHLKERVPAARHLRLGFYSKGASSHGTATTVVENIRTGGMVRAEGRLQQVPVAWRQRALDFGDEQFTGITIPWGDVASAWYSTGIPNTEVYIAAPPTVRRLAKLSGWFAPILAARPVQRFLKNRIPDGGPDEQTRAGNYCLLWGEAVDDSGHRAEARLRTPDGYTLTAATAVHIAQKILAGNAPAGYQTPAMAYGPDLVLEVDGVTRW